jgi:hypothetical protein
MAERHNYVRKVKHTYVCSAVYQLIVLVFS